MVRRTRPEISRFSDVQLHIVARSLHSRPGMTRNIENDKMTIASDVDTPRAKIDWTKPVLWLFAAIMIVLIALPMSWLLIYSVTDKAHHVTLTNFVTLFTDPDFLDPLVTTAIIATSSAVIC